MIREVILIMMFVVSIRDQIAVGIRKIFPEIEIRFRIDPVDKSIPIRISEKRRIIDEFHLIHGYLLRYGLCFRRALRARRIAVIFILVFVVIIVIFIIIVVFRENNRHERYLIHSRRPASEKRSIGKQCAREQKYAYTQERKVSHTSKNYEDLVFLVDFGLLLLTVVVGAFTVTVF